MIHIVNIKLSHVLYQKRHYQEAKCCVFMSLLAARSKQYNVLLQLQRKRHFQGRAQK